MEPPNAPKTPMEDCINVKIHGVFGVFGAFGVFGGFMLLCFK